MTSVPLITHVIHRFDIGGLENGLVNLINNMPADKYRHSIICMTKTTNFSSRINRNNVEIFELHKKEGQDFSIYPKMIRIFKSTKPDIVHSKNFGTIEAQLAAFIAGVKLRVHSEHGRDIDDIDGSITKRILIRRILLMLTQKCIPLSKNLETWLIDTVKVPRLKVVQLYNGVDTAKFNVSSVPTPRGAPSSWGNRTIVGTIGRLELVKDQKTLLLAFIALIAKTPELKNKVGLVVVGDGAERKNLEGIVSSANIEEAVWFSGARNDVTNMLAYMDVFVLPSLNEGISNTILEAMASGVPVIATNVGGNPELVEQNNTGKLVAANQPNEMAEAIMDYVSNPTLALKHGAAGRERVEACFSLEAMVKSYEAVYDSLLSNPNR